MIENEICHGEIAPHQALEKLVGPESFMNFVPLHLREVSVVEPSLRHGAGGEHVHTPEGGEIFL